MHKAWLYIFWLIALGRWFPMQGQATTDAQEYQQYKTMAEYSMGEGDYEKARKLWRVCLTLPKYENDAKTQQKVDDCTKIIAAQQRYQKALNGEEDIIPAFQDLLKLQPISPQDKFFKTRITQKIEQTADKYLKEGNVEQATKLFGYAYQMTPVVGVAFKLEQADKKYVEKYQRNSLPYTHYIQKKNTLKNNTDPVVELDEYAQIIKSADDALKSGNYDLARRKYTAATQVPGHENDSYADEQRLRIARLQQLNRRLEETQNDPRGQLIYARDALSLSPDDATLRPKAAKAAVQVGDEMLSKELFADAKRYYQEAARYGANGMSEKIADTENKIKAKRQENAKKHVEVAKEKGNKQPNLQPAKDQKTHREIPPLVGIAVVGAAMPIFPMLNNGATKVNTNITVQWFGGGQLIILPDSKFSPVLGVNYLPVKLQSINADKTNPLERFDFNLLQIPVGLRFNYPIGNRDFNAHLQAGATLNLPGKFNYTNYAVDVTNTDITTLNKQTLGFYGGIGLSKYLSKRRSVSLMLNYRRTNNLLNPDFKDNATNHSRASLLLQGVGVELIFRVF